MPHTTRTHDCLIIGGGIIGLSLAYELRCAGVSVCVLDRGDPGREASWAGAGILPPGAAESPDPLERLIAYSSRLHAEWAAQLREETGIDTGYRQCGGLYLALREHELEDIRAEAERLTALGVDTQWLSPGDVAGLEPALDGTTIGGYHLPGESQVRNPRHLDALLTACRVRDVEIIAHTCAVSVDLNGDHLVSVQTPHGRFAAGEYCLAAGSWSGGLAAEVGFPIAIKPIRGQIVLLRTSTPLLRRVVNHHQRYLVPRDDGRILVGSTMEDAGFDASTTAGGVHGLLAFAVEVAPSLLASDLERTWAGLRPATADNLPILGKFPHLENAWIATGHFRNGLTLSTATAREMARLMRGEPSTLDLRPFSPSRFADEGTSDRPPPPPPHATPGEE